MIRRAEKTTEQVLVGTSVDGRLTKRQPLAWEKKVRKMRRDPTLGFLRDMFMAPILASEWTVVADDAKYRDAVPLIDECVIPKRLDFLRHTFRGLMDFGWQCFEKIYAFEERDGFVHLRHLKPLLQDITHLLVDEKGHLIGAQNIPIHVAGHGVTSIINGSTFAGPWIELSLDEVLVVYRDVEGTNWYGEALMRRAESPYDNWEETEQAAQRFDKKIAGAHWVVYYPLGTSMWEGVETDNFDIAKAILSATESSGRMAIPQKVLDFVESANDLSSLSEDKLAWKVELLSAPGSADSSFVGRQKYLDALKARAIGIPERSIFEGQFGTRAEAEAHADFAIDNIEMAHADVVEQVNQHVINVLLDLNYGASYVDHVYVQPSPLSEAKRMWLRRMYESYFSTQSGEAEEVDAVDWASIRELIGLPLKNEE